MSRERDRWQRAKQVLDDVIAIGAGEECSRLVKEASALYQASAETWRQAPNPSLISPGGFLSNSRSRTR